MPQGYRNDGTKIVPPSVKGIKRSLETKKRMSVAAKKSVTPEKIERTRLIGKANLGRKHSKSAKTQMSISRKGRTSPNKGKKLSEEWKKNIGKAGKGRIKTIEERSKLREAQLRLVRTGKHIFWKGGIYPENEKARGTLEYKLWRETVFKRDRFKCQMPDCNTNEKYVEANHIKKFSEYPELRLVVDNGITLCRTCHNKTKGKEHSFECIFSLIIEKKKYELF